MQVPVIATLVNTEGHILYQNQASLAYWGALMAPQGITTSPTANELRLCAGRGRMWTPISALIPG